MSYVAIWGVTSLAALVVGWVLAVSKNRDHSYWAAWCFLVPPLVVILAAMPRLAGPRPRRKTLDEEDRTEDRTS